MLVLDAELAPLLIPLEDILIATDNFAEENLLKQGGKSDVYKGALRLRSKVAIDVVIRKYRFQAFEFYEEIKRICGLKHRNAASFIGFCDEADAKMIVMERVVNGSLDKHLSDATLTWSQRLHICFGAALAFECWKSNDTKSYNTKGFKILLDKDWEAKLLLCISSWYHTKTSDVYALGVILLEVLSGRKVTISDVNRFQAKMEKNYDEEGDLDDIIPPYLRKQMHTQSLTIFSEIICKCLKEQSEQLSDIYQAVGRLKEALEIQWKHENLLWVENFAYLKIPLTQIELATNNFAYTRRINSYRYYDVYKAELPKKTVIFKCIDKYEKTTKDFFTEIEMLTSCKHPNLLTLLGFCDEDSEMILVFEYDFKETLNDYLRDTSRRTDLPWEQQIRICLDIAHGLKYLHNLEGKPSMTHQVIQSGNVFLDENLTAKIANFRLSEFSSYAKSLWQSRAENFRTWLWDTMDAPWIPPGQRLVVDDIYSLGVILIEILTRGLANDRLHMAKSGNWLVSTRQQHLEDEKLQNMIDPTRVMEKAQELSYSLKRGYNQLSFDAFSKITYQCLVETPSERPTWEVVIKSLEKALYFQVVENLRIPLEVIQLATKNFDETYCIGLGGYGAVYKAQLNHFDIRSPLAVKMGSTCDITVAIKRILSREDSQGKEGFLAELDVLSRCEHPNIVSLLGFCVEGNEMLLVYEHVSNGSLDDYLGSTDKIIILTWAQRLKVCIDIAHGLNYLHKNMDYGRRIIHRDIKSANILLGKNWDAKIADFGLSKFHPANHQESTINTNNIAGTNVYLDPEYSRTHRLKKASDIYSFGVVLFEIFSGTLAYDSVYTWENEKGLAPIARRHFKKGTLREMLDPQILDEANDELGFIVKVGPDHDSLDTFSTIANKCIAKTQAERPTIEVIIKELEKALYFQENRMKTLKISLESIKLGVQNFNVDNCIMRGGYGMLYKGKVEYKKVAVKRFSVDRYLNGAKFSWEHGFLKEFEVLFKYKQENIIGLVGFCKEMEEKIIVYEHASKGSLDRYLTDANLSWTKRLKICIDIANGLKFLHGGDVGLDVLIHRDIKSSNILLTKDWKAKICGFEHATTYPANREMEYVINDVAGSPGYCDPMYWDTRILTKESDIYSFGVILFEILCGRLACPEDFRDRDQFLDVFVKRHFQVARLDEIVFDGIKEQIVLQSFATFRRIAFQCLHDERSERPTARDVVVELQKALEFQEAHERGEAELHRNYKEILMFSKSPEIYSTMAKKYIYAILSKGILLEDDKREIIQVLQQTTCDIEHSVQLIREEDNDYHSES